MPRIIGRAEQDEAVKKIKAALKELGVTKEFLETANPAGEYTISFKGPDKRTYSTTIFAKSKGAVDELAKAYRDRVAKDMMELAANNRIELEADEKEIFGVE